MSEGKPFIVYESRILSAGFCSWISEVVEGNVKSNVDRQLPLEYISSEAQ